MTSGNLPVLGRLSERIITAWDRVAGGRGLTGRCVPSHRQMESVLSLILGLRGIESSKRVAADADFVGVSVLHPFRRLVDETELGRLAVRGGHVVVFQPIEAPCIIELLFPVEGDSVRVVWYRDGLALRAHVLHHEADGGGRREVSIDFGVDAVNQRFPVGRSRREVQSVADAKIQEAHELARSLVVRGLSAAMYGAKLLFGFVRPSALAGNLRPGEQVRYQGGDDGDEDFAPRDGHARSVDGHRNGGKA